MKEKIILPSILAISILAISLMATNVIAEDLNKYPPIVQKIAERFNLDVGDVQQVFDEERDERRAEGFARFADRLDEMVSDGKLTQSQWDAILDKHEEIQDAMERLGDLSIEERRGKVGTLREEFGVWIKEQGIDESLMRGMGRGFTGLGRKGGLGEVAL